MMGDSAQYGWQDHEPAGAHDYLLPAITNQIRECFHGRPVTIVDLGCGNGYVASRLSALSHEVIGIDASPDGITIARSAYPSVKFEVCSIYDDKLPLVVGQSVDCVIAVEVVEHLYLPKKLFEQSGRILRPGGMLIVTTPYHGYFKNLALSVLNQWDRHFKVEWDGGHIKFFSRNTLARMARGAGFKNPRVQGVGRLPGLWKSLVMVLEK